VWSFGCIVLELATCSVLDESEIKDVLFDMKQDSEEIETVLGKVAKVYSEDLANFIRKCLTRNFHQRPTTKDLCKMSFGQESLTLIGSSLGAEITQSSVTKTIPSPGMAYKYFFNLTREMLKFIFELILKLLQSKLLPPLGYSELWKNEISPPGGDIFAVKV